MKKVLLILLCLPMIGFGQDRWKLRSIDTTFYNGVHYIGGSLNNKKSGFGQLTFPNGSSFIGEFKNDMANGQGTAYYSDGSTYVGQFVNDKKQGKGTYSLHMIIGGVEVFFYSYNGNFYNNRYHGYGKMRYKDGTVKEGIWKNGEFVE